MCRFTSWSTISNFSLAYVSFLDDYFIYNVGRESRVNCPDSLDSQDSREKGKREKVRARKAGKSLDSRDGLDSPDSREKQEKIKMICFFEGERGCNQISSWDSLYAFENFKVFFSTHSYCLYIGSDYCNCNFFIFRDDNRPAGIWMVKY